MPRIELVDEIAGERFARREDVCCPLCGGVYSPDVFEGRFGMTVAIAYCSADRIAFQTPRPTIEASRAYMNWRWGSGEDDYVARQDDQLRRAAGQLRLLSSLDITPGRLLDFGAGVGSFVSAARAAGWQVTGVETSIEAMRRGREEYSVELADEVPDGPFDAITLWDVVEHLRDPAATLRDLAARLVPGGVVVLETGNWESWRRLADGERWGLFLFDHHYYFTPSSLRATTLRAGLREMRVLPGSRTRPSFRPSSRWRTEWSSWLRARRRWPRHGTMDLMIAVARR